MGTRPFSFSDYFFSSPEYGPGAFETLSTPFDRIRKIKEILARAKSPSNTQYLDRIGRGPYTSPVEALDEGVVPNVADISKLIPETPLDIGLTAAGGVEAAAGPAVRGVMRGLGRTALAGGSVAAGAEGKRRLDAGDRAGAASSFTSAGLGIAGLVSGAHADSGARRARIRAFGGEEDPHGNIWVRRGKSFVRVDETGSPINPVDPVKTGLADKAALVEDRLPYEWGEGPNMGPNMKLRGGKPVPEPPPDDFSHPVLTDIRSILANLDEPSREVVVRRAITGKSGGNATMRGFSAAIRQKMIDAGIQPNELGRLGDLPLVSYRNLQKGGSNVANLEAILHQSVQEGRTPLPEPPAAAPTSGPMPPRQGPPAPVMAFDKATGQMVPTMPTRGRAAGSRVPAPKAEKLPSSRVALGPAAPQTRIPGEEPLFLDIPGRVKEELAVKDRWQKSNNKITNELPSRESRNVDQNPGLLEKINAITRATKASFDLSAPRQAAPLIPGNPITSVRNAMRMIKAAASEKSYQGDITRRQQDPMYLRGQQGGLFDTAGVGQSEEAFQAGPMIESTLQKGGLPGRALAGGFRASERGFQNFLDNMRLDVFSGMVKKGEAQLASQGKNVVTHGPEFQNLYAKAAEYSNKGTGRGTPPTAAAPLMAKIFWSPRLMAARLGHMKDIATWWTRTDIPPVVKRKMYGDAVAAVGTGMATLYAAQQAGAEVNLDPDSADFGKIKVGNTRFDIWGGYQQPVRALLRIGAYSPENRAAKQATPTDIATQYFRNKLSPVPSAFWDALDPRFGQTRTEAVGSDLAPVPLIGQDVWEAIQQNPSLTPEQKAALALSAGGSAFFGAGVNSYQPTQRQGQGKQPKRRGGRSAYRPPTW